MESIMTEPENLSGTLVYTERIWEESIARLEFRALDVRMGPTEPLADDLYRPNPIFSSYPFSDIQTSIDGNTISFIEWHDGLGILNILDIKPQPMLKQVIEDWVTGPRNNEVHRRWDWYQLSADGNVLVASSIDDPAQAIAEFGEELQVPVNRLSQIVDRLFSTSTNRARADSELIGGVSVGATACPRPFQLGNHKGLPLPSHKRIGNSL